MREALRDIRRLFLPEHCRVCRAQFDEWLCPDCSEQLATHVKAARCEVCGLPLADALTPCARCLGRERRLIGRIARLGVHAGVLRELIHQMKYSGRWEIAERLARQLREEAFAKQMLEQAQAIVPVPLHWKRHLRRGFNQAELMARAVASPGGAPVVAALRRVRDTFQQSTASSITARLKNVQGAFAMKAGSEAGLAGKRIVLVDDVHTTGATLRAAARALRAAHPARIDALVLAVADVRNKDFAVL